MATVLLFFAVISILILIHELGHFIAARAFGIRVEEFALGFPPRLTSIVRGETRYSLNAIPLGGYVKMTGEEDPSDPKSLAGRSIPTRVTVLVAGVAMNLALAIILFTIFFTFPQVVAGPFEVEIVGVASDSPAAQAGLKPADIVLRTNPQLEPGDFRSDDAFADMQPLTPASTVPFGGQPVESFDDFSSFTQAHLEREVSVLVGRGAEPVVVRLIPRVNPPPGQGAMGVSIRESGSRVETKFKPSFGAIGKSFEQIYRFGSFLNNIFSSDGAREITGPIGIAQVTGEVARSGVLPLLGFTGILSLNLAVLNILPIPALDGGRLLFVIIEAARGGKRIAPQKEAIIHLMGFIVLIGFIILISFNDIGRIVRGEDILR